MEKPLRSWGFVFQKVFASVAPRGGEGVVDPQGRHGSREGREEVVGPPGGKGGTLKGSEGGGPVGEKLVVQRESAQRGETEGDSQVLFLP